MVPQASVESRHLGLVTAGEIENLKEKMMLLAETAEKTLDLDGILQLAQSTVTLEYKKPSLPPLQQVSVRIGVALDEAFCFYYADNLELLEEMGAKLVPFSPLHDKSLPPDLDGLYLGGGYPELYARSLAENETMRQSVRQAVTNEMPTIAECGGFLYLQQSLADRTGNDFPMAGALPGKGQMTDQLGPVWLCGSFIASGANDLSRGRTNQGPFLSLFGYDAERRKFFGPKTKRRVFLRSGRAAVVRGISPFVFLEQSGRSIPFFGAVRHHIKRSKKYEFAKNNPVDSAIGQDGYGTGCPPMGQHCQTAAQSGPFRRDDHPCRRYAANVARIFFSPGIAGFLCG